MAQIIFERTFPDIDDMMNYDCEQPAMAKTGSVYIDSVTEVPLSHNDQPLDLLAFTSRKKEVMSSNPGTMLAISVIEPKWKGERGIRGRVLMYAQSGYGLYFWLPRNGEEFKIVFPETPNQDQLKLGLKLIEVALDRIKTEQQVSFSKDEDFEYTGLKEE